MKTSPLLSIVAGLASACLALSAAAQEWDMPRTADGRPDLQGIWTNATQTPMERPEEFGTKGAPAPASEPTTTIPCDRWRSVACCPSVPVPARRCCRSCTTTTTRSCRPPVMS